MKTLFNILFGFFNGNSSKDYIGLSDFKKIKPEKEMKNSVKFEEKSSLTGLLKRV